MELLRNLLQDTDFVYTDEFSTNQTRRNRVEIYKSKTCLMQADIESSQINVQLLLLFNSTQFNSENPDISLGTVDAQEAASIISRSLQLETKKYHHLLFDLAGDNQDSKFWVYKKNGEFIEINFTIDTASRSEATIKPLLNKILDYLARTKTSFIHLNNINMPLLNQNEYINTVAFIYSIACLPTSKQYRDMLERVIFPKAYSRAS